MRNRWVMVLLPIVALSTALATRSSAAPTRTKVDCAAFRADVEKSTKAVGFPMTIKPGDWAKTPAALRVLPPNASFCGSSGTSVFVVSPLFGKDLEAYYRPIFEKLGCKPVKCEITDKKTGCDCHGGGGFGRVGTEELNEAYSIHWM